MKKQKVINFFGGPGAGKSTSASGTFTELKRRTINSEYVPEFAKDAAWEKRSKKFFKAQQHIFGEQSWRIERLRDEVDIIVTDSPILLGLVYMPSDYRIPKLREAILEDYHSYDNLNIFINRKKKFNPLGRMQNAEEAQQLDLDIKGVLEKNNLPYISFDYSRNNPFNVIDCAISRKWDKDVPELLVEPTLHELLAQIKHYYSKDDIIKALQDEE